MTEFPILSVLTYLPLIGAFVILFVPRDRHEAIKSAAVATSAICLALATLAWLLFKKTVPQFQFVEQADWIPALGISYHMGVDGVSMPMVWLTALVSFLSILYSWIIKERVKEYFILFLLLQTAVNGVFCALDFFLFYIFWEVSLVPMYFIIGVWGGPRREYAAIKFFLYTLVGSLLMLLAIIILYFASGPAGHRTLDIVELIRIQPMAKLAPGLGLAVFWAFFVGFAIKVPCFPFHTWLPDAHVEAPTAGSVILAGLLLKLGAYGMIRISLPMMPEQFLAMSYWVGVLALISIIYGSLVAMAQSDLKKLIAYSSIGHMGFVTLGIAAMNTDGISGAVMQMFSHGLITSGLFLLVGVIYERAHIREINGFGGLGKSMPNYFGVFVFISMASLGLPALSGFVAELFVLIGAYDSSTMSHAPALVALGSPWFAWSAIIGIILTAAYMLWTVQRIFMGPENEKWAKLPDINALELACLAPLMFFTLLVGCVPMIVLEPIRATAAFMQDQIVRIVGG
jgi:NADH-quinone oxidoreductase subunit M